MSRARDIDYFPVDIDDYSLIRQQVDITNLPFEDGSIDWILCSHVLEHVADDAKAMRELARVLSPGGAAVLQHPIDVNRETTYEDPSITDPQGRSRAFGQHDHVRVYGLDHADRLRASGLCVQVIDYANTMSMEEVRRYGLKRSRGGMVGEALHICTHGQHPWQNSIGSTLRH